MKCCVHPKITYESLPFSIKRGVRILFLLAEASLSELRLLDFSKVKSLAEHIPEPVGKALAGISYSWRLGGEYRRSRAELDRFEQLGNHEQKAWIENALMRTVKWAKVEHPFYRDFYGRPELEMGLDNFHKLPIVTRDDLQQVSLEKRSILEKGRCLVNTGGSTGHPLVFYLDSKAFAREWAHMHFVWERLGYRTTDLKLTFRGKNLGNRPLVYSPIHNEYVVNAYCPHERVTDALWRKMRRNRIRFLHGYPSAIYDFIQHCVDNRSSLIEELSKSLKGILYASEYPAPIYRDPVEAVLGVKGISWYGHSEFSVLAYEVEKYVYRPLHTYGYAEAVPSDEGHRLVCTGYYNRVCPFIRYDTGDLIEPVGQDEILRTFRIRAGRIGDFVTDGRGKRVSLTALIFGRHHPIFDRVRFLQITQKKGGHAVLILTCSEHDELRKEEVLSLMDLNNVDIKFDVLVVNEPFRTMAGKVTLKVPYERLKSDWGTKQIGIGIQ